MLFKASVDWLEKICTTSNETLIFQVTQEFSLDPDMCTSCATFLSHLQFFIACVLAAISDFDLATATRLFRFFFEIDLKFVAIIYFLWCHKLIMHPFTFHLRSTFVQTFSNFKRAGGSESDSEGEQIIDSDSDQVPLNERLCTFRQTGKNHENQHW